MFGLIIRVGLWLLGLCRFGKPDPEKLGEQIQAGKDAEQILAEVEAQRAGGLAPGITVEQLRDITIRPWVD